MNKFEFHAVTEKDIEKIVKQFLSNKAPGHNRVSARVLRDSLPATLPVITKLINPSFASNCFAGRGSPPWSSQTSNPAILMSPKTPALYPFYL